MMIDSGSKRNLSLNYHNNIIWGRRVERVRFAGGGGRGSSALDSGGKSGKPGKTRR